MDLKSLLNERQYEAVTSSSQYLRIIAGAGSGKTRVLTYRIAHLIYEWNVPSWRILAITFTNKVAKEMSDRVKAILQEEKVDTQIKTFHAFAAYFLRQEISAIGYPSTFTILDEEDQLQLVKDICASRGHKRNSEVVKLARNYISSCKLNEKYPDDINYQGYDTFPYEKECLEIYRLYEERKEGMLCLDFDDLLLKTNYILENNPLVRMKWSNKYDHILVDEFQDTNNTEFKLLNYLMNNNTYLYVVGDPDQTIYTWRGANQKIIVDLDKRLARITTIVLDRNYRSTQAILDSANKLIAHNRLRVPKDLYTRNEDGEPIVLKSFLKNSDEANYIAGEIARLVKYENYSYKDIAILYRANYITQEIEQAFVNKRIPYKVFGALKFYQRKEIKDLIAYFNLMVNEKDDISFERIINVPRRKIGDATIDLIKHEKGDKHFYEFIKEVDISSSDINASALAKLKALITRIELFRESIKENEKLFNMYLKDFITDIGYFDYLEKEYGEEDSDDRKENVMALLDSVQNYMNNPDATFVDYLQNVALLSSQDDVFSGDFVTLMTVHTAKGLEFPIVFVMRMNQNTFPSLRAMSEGYQGLEEERRLCYVAFTRAMKKLYVSTTNGLSYSSGGADFGTPSQFIKEAGLVLKTDKPKTVSYGEYNPYKKVRSFNEFDSSNYNEYQHKENPKQDGPMIQEVTQSINLESSPKSSITWNVGDIVIHKTLGKGKVLEVIDTIIKVDFEKFGIKTILGNHPSVKKGE